MKNVIKAWKKLTDKQKIEQLHLEVTRPTPPSLGFWLLFIIFIVFSTATSIGTITALYSVQDIYVQTGLEMQPDTMQKIVKLSDKLEDARNIVIAFWLFLFVMFVWYLYNLHKWNKKYKAFARTIKERGVKK